MYNVGPKEEVIIFLGKHLDHILHTKISTMYQSPILSEFSMLCPCVSNITLYNLGTLGALAKVCVLGEFSGITLLPVEEFHLMY